VAFLNELCHSSSSQAKQFRYLGDHEELVVHASLPSSETQPEYNMLCGKSRGPSDGVTSDVTFGSWWKLV
jgi:hypothetical protein